MKLALILSFSTLFAQGPTPLQEMVQTEHAFARMAAEKNTERGSYVRIWRGFGSYWRIVVDVTNPHR